MPLEIILRCPIVEKEMTFAEACMAASRAIKSPFTPFYRSDHNLTPVAGPVSESCWAHDEAFWSRMDDEHLMKEYLQMQKASFNAMFGRNACQARVRIARQLHARGITHIPNIFGSIEVD